MVQVLLFFVPLFHSSLCLFPLPTAPYAYSEPKDPYIALGALMNDNIHTFTRSTQQEIA